MVLWATEFFLCTAENHGMKEEVKQVSHYILCEPAGTLQCPLIKQRCPSSAGALPCSWVSQNYCMTLEKRSNKSTNYCRDDFKLTTVKQDKCKIKRVKVRPHVTVSVCCVTTFSAHDGSR